MFLSCVAIFWIGGISDGTTLSNWNKTSSLTLFLTLIVLGFGGMALMRKANHMKQLRRDKDAMLLFNAVKSGNIHKFAVFLRPFYTKGKVAVMYGDQSPPELESTLIAAFDDSTPVIALEVSPVKRTGGIARPDVSQPMKVPGRVTRLT